MSDSLIEVENLEVVFQTSGGSLTAVSDVSFKMKAGETLGIVGESGSGKSVVSLSIMGLIPNPPGQITNGQISFDNKNLLNLSRDEMQEVIGEGHPTYGHQCYSKALAASAGYPVGDVRPPLTTFKELGDEGTQRREKLCVMMKKLDILVDELDKKLAA